MKVAFAALLVFSLGMAPGLFKYAGPPPGSKMAASLTAPAQAREAALLRPAAPWPPSPAKPAGIAGLFARLKRS